MKNLIILLFITVVFFSCEMITEDPWYVLPNLVWEWDEIKTLDDVSFWVTNNIKYKKDKGDVWQYPTETIVRGKGNCEDKALLFMAIAYKKLNKKPMLAIYYYPDRKEYHAEVIYNKVEYFALDENRYMVELYNFDEIQNKIKFKRGGKI